MLAMLGHCRTKTKKHKHSFFYHKRVKILFSPDFLSFCPPAWASLLIFLQTDYKSKRADGGIRIG